MGKIKKFFVYFLILICIFLLLKKFIFISEEDRIKQTIKIAEKAIENNNYTEFMKHFSFEYRDEYGNTWGTLFFLVKNILKNYQKVDISIRNLNIEIFDKTAVVKIFGEGKAISPSGEIIKEAGRFLIKFKKEGKKWKIVWVEEDKYRFD
ncbi:MAG TPA: hypothetical protein P5150_00390 [Candidatus Ratteibacteria bacterium]|nr:hypothetical protein [Candidatus Ratteibacteria bacterium]